MTLGAGILDASKRSRAVVATHGAPTGEALQEAGSRLLARQDGPRRSGGKIGNARLAVRRCWQAGATVLCGLILSMPCYGEMVFGYYAGYEYWQMSPDEIDWSGINCVLHFAAPPQSNGTINLSAFQLFPARIEQMVRLARQNDACVLLTVGGAQTRRHFAHATADSRVLQSFIENIVSVVVQYGYDGVDIDWEPLQDSDEAQFTALIRGLRAALDAVVPGAMLTTSVAFEWGTQEHKNTTSIVAGVINDLDFVHLMAYALAGPWGGWVTWHNSALHNGGETFPRSTRELPSAELMVEAYAAAGVPHDKMTLGLGLFGKIWRGGAGTSTGGVTEPRQSWTTEPTISGEYQYHQIIARNDFQGNEHWDDIAKNPYIAINKPEAADDLFVPYENPRSIKEKVRYAAERHLGGVMIWELRGDYLPDNSRDQHPLLAALKEEYQAQYGTLPRAWRHGPSASPPGRAPSATRMETPRK
jgi:chitinase